MLEALRDLPERPQFVSIELNSVDMAQNRACIALLRELGYQQFKLVPQKIIANTRVQVTDLQGRPFEHVFSRGASGVFGDDLEGTWLSEDALLGALRPPFAEWQDIHATLTPTDLVNVAIDRPATQSSTSEWSTNRDPTVDARVANNGDTTSGTFFHTDAEEAPWWRVELEKPTIVEKVVIFNRATLRERLLKLTVLGSADGKEWFPLCAKTDDAPFSVFAAQAQPQPPVRFVLVRKDQPGFLHFEECQVFAKPDRG